ncbi:MAG: UDP-3-O-acyl-N-acetylglucosamine deacetylase [Alphaproteobacteria bacterium]|nr:UDP-3-O-acyl-N-acetylglucosamine deacetylase [Alphaproteobacteria bacterium]
MSFLRQSTLKNRISCAGVGLHSGARVNMTLEPAAPDSGVVFRRSDDAGGGGLVPARVEHISDSTLCTTLCNRDGVTVSTVEHLMAAFAGCGVDNVLVDLDGPEVPIMDGSSAPFVFLIECAGVVEQPARRNAIRVLERVEVRDGESAASLVPAEGFSISFEIDFASAAVARQDCYFTFRNGNFKSQLSRARTFGFADDVERLRALGLGRGGSLDNVVVVSGQRVLNEDGLRYEDEFVRHKALDSIGDLYLLGAPIIGHFHGRRSGHALNHRLMRELLADRESWCLSGVPAEPAGVGEELPAGLAASA